LVRGEGGWSGPLYGPYSSISQAEHILTINKYIYSLMLYIT
jgi:hypothetical protein